MSFLCVCAVVVVVPRAFFFLYTYRHPSLSSTCYYSRCVRGTTTTTRSCFSLVNTNRESFKLIALVPISKKKPILFFVFCFFFFFVFLPECSCSMNYAIMLIIPESHSFLFIIQIRKHNLATIWPGKSS